MLKFFLFYFLLLCECSIMVRYRWIFTTKRSLFLEKIDFQKRHNFPCLKKVLPLKILLSRDFFTTLEEKRIFIESFFPHFF